MTATEVPAAGRKVAKSDNMPLDDKLRETHKALFERFNAWAAKAKKAKLKPTTEADVAKLEALYLEGHEIALDADTIRAKEKAPFFETGKLIDKVFNEGIRDQIGDDKKNPGLAQRILQAAADRRLEITREKQRQADLDAAALRQKADEIAAQAAAQEAKGQVRVADATAAQVQAVEGLANQQQAFASAPIEQASRNVGVSTTSRVAARLVCTDVDRATLDLNALRPYFKQVDLIVAVNALLNTGMKTCAGAVIKEQAVGSVRRS